MAARAAQREAKDRAGLSGSPMLVASLGLPIDVTKTKRLGAYRESRDLYLYLLHTFGQVSLKGLSAHIGIDRKGVQQIIDAVKARLETDENAEAFVDQIGSRLTMQTQLRQRIEADGPELARLFPSGPTAVQLAFRYKVSIAEVAPLVHSLSEKLRTFSDSEWRGGAHKPSKDQTLSRFGSAKPEGGVDLKVNHPALVEGRTIFPSTVVSPRDTERLLVSGHNNPKLGAEVRKGPWKGFPIFQLTLEERATCPRSCALWAGCYGNAMHMARRHDHRDPDFLVLLEMELTALAGKHPFGFAVRLHTLGDFYSVEYVEFWERMLDELPSLHVFGYTANRALADDETECAIGAEIEEMNVAFKQRCFIRFSGEPGAGGTRVFETPPPAGSAEGAGIIMCPAQTGESTACATCALCWSESAWDKCVGFLKHGMRPRRFRANKKGSKGVSNPPEPAPYIKIDIPGTVPANELATKRTPVANSVLQCNAKKSAAADEAALISALAQKRRTAERIARDIRINESIIRHGEAPGATKEARKEADKARALLVKLQREADL